MHVVIGNIFLTYIKLSINFAINVASWFPMILLKNINTAAKKAMLQTFPVVIQENLWI